MKKSDLPRFTVEDLEKIEKLAMYGMQQDRIASLFNMSKNHLLEIFKRDPESRAAYDRGLAMAEHEVSRVAYEMACSGKNTSMTQFWLRCKVNWKETQVVEHKGTTIEDLVNAASEEQAEPLKLVGEQKKESVNE